MLFNIFKFRFIYHKKVSVATTGQKFTSQKKFGFPFTSSSFGILIKISIPNDDEYVDE